MKDSLWEMLFYDDVLDFCLELLADRPHTCPQMSEVILTFAIPEVIPDHLQDHFPYFKWKKRVSGQAPYMFAGDGWIDWCRGDRAPWRRVGHLEHS